ncbi:MAG: lysophospholipid acyltransferase family protein [Panacagrimonas sp.]
MGTDTAMPQDFQPPSMDQMRRFMRIGRWWFQPEFLGLWELDLKKPALFVGNHTIFGLTDAPLMIEHLYTQYGVMLRGLGDRGHFSVPGWGKLLVKHGMVLGSPENCSALMKACEHVLVFPGGAREVMRRRGEAYQLIWKERAGFARLAIEHGYDIIPFGSVGPDESFKILLDANDVLKPGWRRTLAERSGLLKATRNGDFLPPLAVGLGPTMIPRPQRYYFGFGPRISTDHVRGQHGDRDLVWTIRQQVAHAVEDQIWKLRKYREEDRLQNWSPVRRWLAPLHA